MEQLQPSSFEQTVNSAATYVADAGSRLWNAAYEERYLLGSAAAIAAALFLKRDVIGPRSVDLLADLVPLRRTASETQASASSQLSYAHLLEAMRDRDMSTADLAKSVSWWRKLGHGANFEAFRIKDLPEYIVRKRIGWPPTSVAESLTEIEDILPGVNIGQPVARTGSLQVLKRQPGEALVTPHQLKGYRLRWNLRRQTRMLAEVPQESFDEFAQTLQTLNHRRLYLDPHGGNIVLNRSTMRFGPVDITPMPGDEVNNSHHMLEAAMLSNCREAIVEPYYSLVKNKIGLAARRAGLPK